ncbi:MAG: ribosome biogenesis GTPase YlqF [Lachnospiraceae bacterium]|nr:ribosome biogenesis GTPase YlqF [Lachnospiraceae bacterium]
MIVQWYPGHMNKARKMMEADMNLVDLVIEILDARVPLASRNPEINKMAKNKMRIVLLNKADLADKAVNDMWKKYFESRGIGVVMINSKNKEGIRNVLPKVKEVCAAKIERDRARGIKNRPIRAMVVGIPNVGKSTFINAFSGKNVAKTGNKPGVTKGKQWIKINNELELLDTPGILWPKFEDQNVGIKLALIGSINDEILQVEELCGNLLVYLYENYPELIKERFDITEDTLKPLEEEQDGYICTKESLLLDAVAKKRGCLKQGGVSDYFRASNVLLEEYRNGKIGRISLERP